MTDYSELKHLAEAARAEQERVIKLAANGEGWEALPAQSSFRCVADPAAVLALIRQNERLRAGVDDDLAEVERIEGEYTKQWRKARALRIERDQLKAEVEALRREMSGLKSDVRTAESAHDQSQKIVRVLKAQVATLLGELDEARADRSKYRQWMRSAVRQNRAERKNVKAFRETQDELVAQIARLQREMDGLMASGRVAGPFSVGYWLDPGRRKVYMPNPNYIAPQEPKQ